MIWPKVRVDCHCLEIFCRENLVGRHKSRKCLKLPEQQDLEVCVWHCGHFRLVADGRKCLMNRLPKRWGNRLETIGSTRPEA